MKSTGVPIGSVAPEFAAESLASSPVKLAGLRGRVVVLLFYRGHWCQSCRRQLDQLAASYETVQSLRAELVAISADPLDSTRAFPTATRWPFPIIGDPALQLIDRYGVRDPDDPEGRQIARPSVFVLDLTGVVRYAHVGIHRQDRPTPGSIMLALETLSGHQCG